MKILFISRKNPESVGGLARFASELSKQFKDSGYLLSPKSFTLLLKLPFLRIDVIHLCDATLLPLGIILKLILKKPLTVTAHGLDLTFPNLIYQWLIAKTLPYLNTVILDSNPAISLLSSFKIPKEKIKVINPGISINQFKKSKKINLSETSGKIVLLSVGNLVLRKGHAWFIKNVFLKLSSDFIYFVVGDGPEKNYIKKIIEKNKLENRVFLLGRLSNPELSYVFSKTDIYISPNQKTPNNFESFGIANGEASAMGLPVIASNVDGISEAIINKKNGILVSPIRKAFISSLTNLKNLKNRKKLGKKGKAYTLFNYPWEKSAKSYFDVFSKLNYKN